MAKQVTENAGVIGRSRPADRWLLTSAQVKLAVVDAGGEGTPLVRHEDQRGAARVAAVGPGDDPVAAALGAGQDRNLDARAVIGAAEDDVRQAAPARSVPWIAFRTGSVGGAADDALVSVCRGAASLFDSAPAERILSSSLGG
jgi:hypothetical protein